MGSKEPIPKMILLQRLQYQRTDKLELSWSLYRLKPSFYNFAKKELRFFSEKGDPWGDLNAPETTSDNSFLFFLSDLLKDSEKVRVKSSQTHFKSTFGSAYFISKNNAVKLAKPTKKEPRKASFPWDLGLLFVQPMKYALIFQNIKFYNSERKSNACDLQVFFKIHAKKTISLQLDLGCL